MKITPFSACLVAGIIAVLGPSAPTHAAGSLGRPLASKQAAVVTPAGEVGADLAIALSASPWDPDQSSELVFTVSVTNLGKSSGSPATVTSPLSDFAAWSDGDEACEPIGDAVVCTFEPLAGGESRQVWFALEVFEPYPTALVQEVRLTAEDPDPSTGNNFSWVRTVLDVEPPVVETVRARVGKSARRLRACTQLVSEPNRLEVTFSEAMSVGSISHLADSVDSYRVVRPGPDGVYQESSCAAAPEEGLPSNDLFVKILDVLWNDEEQTAELVLQPSDATTDSSGHWRLVACGGLADLAGNPLDGDEDGQGGDDAIIDFRVDEGNVLDNGHFDCGVDFWSAVGAEPEGFVLGKDSEGDSMSASALLESAGSSTTVGAGQCAVGPTPGIYELSALYRLASTADRSDLAPVVGAWVGLACTVFDSSTCDGMTELVGGGTSASIPAPTDGEWNELTARLLVPESAGSVLCTIAAGGEDKVVSFEFDRVRLVPVPVIVDDLSDGLGAIETTR
jgi:hypothetical protein